MTRVLPALLLAAAVLAGCSSPTAAEKDDTAALQAIFKRAPGGAVRLPPGTHHLTKTVVIDLDNGPLSISGDGVASVVMAGPGPAFRFVGTHAGTADPPTVKADVWRFQRAPMIDGVEIVGDHAEADGIEATGTMQLTVSRVLVRKVRHAVRLTGRNRNVLLSDCHLYDNRGVGLFLDDVNLHQINVTGCHISYNAGGGVVSRKGDVRNLQLTGCDIEANMGPGPATANVLLDAGDTVNGTGEVAITGCSIQHTRKAEGSANVRVLGKSKATKEMPLVRQGHVTITGNVFSDVQDNVHLKDCRGVVITGNTFWEGYRHNLLVEGCASVVVGPNNMDRNPHYDRYGKAKEARNAVVIRDSEDLTITGLHLTNVRAPVAVRLESCRRVNLTGCTVLDSSGVGMLLDGVRDSRVSGCLVRDDREGAKPGKSFVLKGGKGNVVTNNVFADGADIDRDAARASGNEGR